jgi:hypothetical protein
MVENHKHQLTYKEIAHQSEKITERESQEAHAAPPVMPTLHEAPQAPSGGMHPGGYSSSLQDTERIVHERVVHEGADTPSATKEVKSVDPHAGTAQSGEGKEGGSENHGNK